MTKKTINVSDDAGETPITVRRRRFSPGSQTTAVSISLPNELNQTTNGIIAKTAQSRSEIITTLIEKGLTQ